MVINVHHMEHYVTSVYLFICLLSELLIGDNAAVTLLNKVIGGFTF